MLSTACHPATKSISRSILACQRNDLLAFYRCTSLGLGYNVNNANMPGTSEKKDEPMLNRKYIFERERILLELQVA